MDALFLILILISIVVGLAIFVAAIVFLVKFSNQNPKMLKTAQRTAFFLPIGLGWIGWILYFTMVKSAVKSDEAASKKVRKSFIFGVVSTILLGIVMIFAAIVIALVASKVEYTNFADTESKYSLEMPCKTPKVEAVNESSARGKGYLCELPDGKSVAMIMNVGGEVFDHLDEESQKQVLDSALESIPNQRISGLAGNAGKLKLLTKNDTDFNGAAAREAEFASDSAMARWKVFFADTAKGREFFQIAILTLDKDSGQKLSEHYNRMISTFKVSQ